MRTGRRYETGDNDYAPLGGLTTMKRDSKIPQFYTTDEVAAILHLNVQTVRLLLQKKELGGIKIGTEWRVSEDHLLKFIQDHENR